MSPARATPTPRQSADRCALRAQVRDDPMLGTAFPAARVLLVEQPGPWGPDGLVESEFDRRLAHALTDRARSEGVRVQLIRRSGRGQAVADRRWALADCRIGQESLRWGRFRHERELLTLRWDDAAGSPSDEPAYLVCAHGRHDPCCAIRGRPVAAALARLRPDQVWETTHVGGDRFAANVLVLPSGLLYGRIAADDVPALVAATEAGQALPERLRGRIGLPPVVQAALAFAHAQLGLRRGLRPLSATPVRDGGATVHLDGPAGQIVVSVGVDRVPATGLTCHNPRPGSFLAYRPEFVDGTRATPP